MIQRSETEPRGRASAAAEKSYLTLTGMVISFAVWMSIGRVGGGPKGMWVGAALNLLRYCVAIWRATHAAVPPPEDGRPAPDVAT